MGASKVLSIIGICISWFSFVFADAAPLPAFFCMTGVTLGIIGLNIKKEKGEEKRDKRLNIICIVEAIVFFLLWLNWSIWVAGL